MLIKLNQILIYGLIAFFVAYFLYPYYIKILKNIKAGQKIRSASVTGEDAKIYKKLHKHKEGKPNLGGGLWLIIMLVMIIISIILQKKGFINNSLFNRQETYIILFGFFSMGLLGFLDDFLNIRGKGKIKGLSANMKLIGMFLFAGFISWWFYTKLGVDSINFWPFAGNIHLGLWYPVITFFITLAITNAINITDGLDGLSGGLMTIILSVFGIITFFNGTFIATTVIVILTSTLCAFLRFNIFPAKIIMGDSGALALGGFLSSLLFLLNMRIGIIIPFFILFLIFIIEIGSSAIQILSKKFFKKKFFSIAPFHHYLENKGISEPSIIMKAWLIQGILAILTIIIIFYQIDLTYLGI